MASQKNSFQKAVRQSASEFGIGALEERGRQHLVPDCASLLNQRRAQFGVSLAFPLVKQRSATSDRHDLWGERTVLGFSLEVVTPIIRRQCDARRRAAKWPKVEKLGGLSKDREGNGNSNSLSNGSRRLSHQGIFFSEEISSH